MLPNRFVSGTNYVMLTDYGEPSCYKEAMLCDDKHKWELAMQSQMDSVNKNYTWDLVSLPSEKHVLPCKWVFKMKIIGDAMSKYKVQLVAKGFKQEKGVDFDEIFSLVMRMITLCVLGLLAKGDMELKQMDVKTSFLHVTYMRTSTCSSLRVLCRKVERS